MGEVHKLRPWRDVVAEMEARHRAQRGERWHLVQVAAGQRDAHVVDWLGKRGYETYYPTLRSLRRVSRKRLSQSQRRARVTVMKPVLEPMFGRYIFTRFDIADGKWRDIFEFHGAAGIVCEHNMPVPISDTLIARLRGAEVDGAIPGGTPAAELFRVGQFVEALEGPFAGFRGEIELIKSAPIDGVDTPIRLTVAIQIFGRLTPTEFEPQQVEPVNLSATP
jgi:transcription antitermination factor NusG